jgi:hypothetical protein
MSNNPTCQALWRAISKGPRPFHRSRRSQPCQQMQYGRMTTTRFGSLSLIDLIRCGFKAISHMPRFVPREAQRSSVRGTALSGERVCNPLSSVTTVCNVSTTISDILTIRLMCGHLRGRMALHVWRLTEPSDSCWRPPPHPRDQASGFTYFS